MQQFINDAGTPSGSKTWVFIFCTIALVKWVVGGETMFGHEFAPFDSTAAAAMIAIPMTWNAVRRHTDAKKP